MSLKPNPPPNIQSDAAAMLRSWILHLLLAVGLIMNLQADTMLLPRREPTQLPDKL